MTKKDPGITENIDREKTKGQDSESHHAAGNQPPEKGKEKGSAGIKNAHASGDGAYGRSDKSIIESDDKGGDEQGDDASY